MEFYSHTKTREGFDITFTALPEDLPLEDTFDPVCNDIPKLYKAIEYGELVYFCAKVTASKDDVPLATDYLGACLYASYASFHTTQSEYYEDMVAEVIAEARTKIEELTQ